MKRVTRRDHDFQGRNEFGRRVWYDVVFLDRDAIQKLDRNWAESRSLKAARKFVRKHHLENYIITRYAHRRRKWIDYERANGKLIQVVGSYWEEKAKTIESRGQ